MVDLRRRRLEDGAWIGEFDAEISVERIATNVGRVLRGNDRVR